MKKQITLIMVLILCSVASMAQQQQQQQKEISSEEFAKMFVTKLSQKIELSKNQKDSVTLVYARFVDDIKKYRAENNTKVINYMMTTRDEQVKKILQDDKKYDLYLLFLGDIKKQSAPQQRPPEQPQHGGQQNPMGPG